MAKQKMITDFTVVRLVVKFMIDLFGVLKNTPSTFKHDIVQYLKNIMMNILCLVVKAMDTPPYDNKLKEMKRNMLIEAHSELQCMQVLLSVLNDMSAMSNQVKAGLDLQIFDIFLNLQRLVCSLNKDINRCESDVNGEPSHTGLNMIETCDCNGK